MGCRSFTDRMIRWRPAASDMAIDGQDLLDRCRRGDEVAWRGFYDLQAPRVAGYVRGIVGDHPDLDDIVQKVFVEVFSSIARYRGESKLSTWLYGVASNVTSKHLRTETRWRRRRDALSDHVRACSSPAAPDPGSEAEARVLAEAIDGVLEAMDVDHRMVWVMREMEGLSTEEVGTALGIPAGTVRSRLFNARKRMLETLRGLVTGSGSGPDAAGIASPGCLVGQ
jgi:RNA polymerase sigma-70 factor (ECF subfamily)